MATAAYARRARAAQYLMVKRSARIRDVPGSCSCLWEYDAITGKWSRVRQSAGCAWHNIWKGTDHGQPE